jgi:dTDP-4-amino-4,6-dideoxygalactose transaminase
VVTDSWDAYLRMSAWGHFNRHGYHFAALGLEALSQTGVGFKRRMAPLGALLADVDLDYLSTYNRIKQRHVEILDSELSGIEGIEMVQIPYPASRGAFYQGYPIRIVKPGVSAAAVLETLTRVGIQASAYPFALHHRLPAYTDPAFRHALLTQQPPPPPRASRGHLPVTDALPSQLLLLSPKYLLTLNRDILQKLKIVLVGITSKTSLSKSPVRPETSLLNRN